MNASNTNTVETIHLAVQVAEPVRPSPKLIDGAPPPCPVPVPLIGLRPGVGHSNSDDTIVGCLTAYRSCSPKFLAPPGKKRGQR